MGGTIVVRVAIEHPDRVSRVVLVVSISLGARRPAPGVIAAMMRFGARGSLATRDRLLRQVLVDLERTKPGWGDRWPALEAYDLEQAGWPNRGRGEPSAPAANQHGANRAGGAPKDQRAGRADWGIVTASTRNHGIAIAYAARLLGTRRSSSPLTPSRQSSSG
jgi:pimeloyl-ACP methyl ester carboxylesterase